MGKAFQPFVEFYFPLLALVACAVVSIIAYRQKRERFRLLLLLYVFVNLFTLLERGGWGPSHWPFFRLIRVPLLVLAPIYILGGFLTWTLFYFALRELTKKKEPIQRATDNDGAAPRRV